MRWICSSNVEERENDLKKEQVSSTYREDREVFEILDTLLQHMGLEYPRYKGRDFLLRHIDLDLRNKMACV